MISPIIIARALAVFEVVFLAFLKSSLWNVTSLLPTSSSEAHWRTSPIGRPSRRKLVGGLHPSDDRFSRTSATTSSTFRLRHSLRPLQRPLRLWLSRSDRTVGCSSAVNWLRPLLIYCFNSRSFFFSFFLFSYFVFVCMYDVCLKNFELEKEKS